MIKTSIDLKKFADAVNMSFDIPDAEKEIAEEALLRFEYAVNLLNKGVEHLDIIYKPFEKHENISVESVISKRGVLNRFKQASKKKFEKFKYQSILAAQKLDYFTRGDAEIKELFNTFELSLNNFEEKLEDFYYTLSNFDTEDFRDKILENIDIIKNESEDLIELINDRIIEHINNELIGKSWISEKENHFNINHQDFKPLLIDLFEERQNLLQGNFAVPNQDAQAMNPSDAQRVLSPNSSRTVNFTEFGDKL